MIHNQIGKIIDTDQLKIMIVLANQKDLCLLPYTAAETLLLFYLLIYVFVFFFSQIPICFVNLSAGNCLYEILAAFNIRSVGHLNIIILNDAHFLILIF